MDHSKEPEELLHQAGSGEGSVMVPEREFGKDKSMFPKEQADSGPLNKLRELNDEGAHQLSERQGEHGGSRQKQRTGSCPALTR